MDADDLTTNEFIMPEISPDLLEYYIACNEKINLNTDD
jgi:hypothetical protein